MRMMWKKETQELWISLVVAYIDALVQDCSVSIAIALEISWIVLTHKGVIVQDESWIHV